MGKQKDPLERLGDLIDQKISSAFDSRDRAAREKDDPWARIEGIVDRAIAKRLDALLEDEDDDEDAGQTGGGRRRSSKDAGDEPKLGILGL